MIWPLECASSYLDLANKTVPACLDCEVLQSSPLLEICSVLSQRATDTYTDVGCVCLVWAGDVVEEEPEEEEEHLGNLDEEEIKKMQSDEVLSLLFLFLFCFFFLACSFLWGSPY